MQPAGILLTVSMQFDECENDALPYGCTRIAWGSFGGRGQVQTRRQRKHGSMAPKCTSNCGGSCVFERVAPPLWRVVCRMRHLTMWMEETIVWLPSGAAISNYSKEFLSFLSHVLCECCSMTTTLPLSTSSLSTRLHLAPRVGRSGSASRTVVALVAAQTHHQVRHQSHHLPHINGTPDDGGWPGVVCVRRLLTAR
jgi:hypothetical protein